MAMILHGIWIYHYLCNQSLSPLMWVWIWIRVMCTTLCEKVCQWIPTDRWFSPGLPVSSTNKTDRHDITTNCIVFGLTWSGLKPLIYSTWCEQTNHYTTNWVANFERKCLRFIFQFIYKHIRFYLFHVELFYLCWE